MRGYAIAADRRPHWCARSQRTAADEAQRREKYAALMTCLLPLRWIAIYSTGRVCHCKNPMRCMGACPSLFLSIASPVCRREIPNFQPQQQNHSTLCEAKQPNWMNVYNKLNCKWHKMSWPSSRQRPDRSDSAHASSSLFIFFFGSFGRSFVFRFRWFLSLFMMKKRNSRSAM